MDDERKVKLAGKLNLSAKNALGDVARRVVVMIVEAGLADADAFRMASESAHGVEVLRPLARRLMRMRADGEENVVVPLGDRGHAFGLGDFRADGDHALDAGRARPLDDRVEIGGEVGKIEVAVAVDESHSATPSPLREKVAGQSPSIDGRSGERPIAGRMRVSAPSGRDPSPLPLPQRERETRPLTSPPPLRHTVERPA